MKALILTTALILLVGCCPAQQQICPAENIHLLIPVDIGPLLGVPWEYEVPVSLHLDKGMLDDPDVFYTDEEWEALEEMIENEAKKEGT